MSIHKSKGLEFPIVILADLNKAFNKMDLQTPVLVHPKLGLGPLYIDLDRHIRYPTLARQAVAGRLSREMRSEEMRVLYVGMTRAKEKLIMTASMPSAPKKLAELAALSALPVPPETVDGATSMAEWILLPLLRRREAEPFRDLAELEAGGRAPARDAPWLVEYHDGVPYGEAPPAVQEDGEAAVEARLPVDREALDYLYPHLTASATPTKLTATQLKGREKDREIAENTAQPYIRRSFSAPRFMAGQRPLTADQRGTATHLAMQYLPLDGDAEETVRELAQKRLLTPEQAQAVDTAAMQRFLRSELAEQLRRADRVEREFRFSLLVPAGEYYAGMDASDEVLLQGVVDLFAIHDGKITVVDFKTDRVTDSTLPGRVGYYRSQLEAYTTALEKIWKLPVARKALYFFHTGQTVDV